MSDNKPNPLVRIKTKIKFIIKNFLSKKPKRIPMKFLREFSMDGKVKITYNFRDDEYPDTKPTIFTKEYVERMKKDAKNRKINYYGKTDIFLFDALKKYRKGIEGKEGVDMGSVTGWYSAVTLANDAKTVTL